jgi:hypothetical protein
MMVMSIVRSGGSEWQRMHAAWRKADTLASSKIGKRLTGSFNKRPRDLLLDGSWEYRIVA